MGVLMKSYFLVAIAALFVFFSSSAFANCDSVGDDAWNTLSEQMAAAFETGDYNLALTYARALEMTCSESPIVNHITSEIYTHLGDAEKSLMYIERAIENTYKFEVPPALLRKMWDKRIALELDLAKLESEPCIALEEQAAALEEENLRLKDSSGFRLTPDDMWTDVMWAGTGLAIGGVAVAITGITLTALNFSAAGDAINSPNEDGEHRVEKDFNSKNQKVQAGYALIGAGAGLAVTGTVFAVLGAVKRKKSSPEAVETSFYVHPTGAGMRVEF